MRNSGVRFPFLVLLTVPDLRTFEQRCPSRLKENHRWWFKAWCLNSLLHIRRSEKFRLVQDHPRRKPGKPNPGFPRWLSYCRRRFIQSRQILSSRLGTTDKLVPDAGVSAGVSSQLCMYINIFKARLSMPPATTLLFFSCVAPL